MSHARQQIRDAVVTALTGATSAGSAVYSGHVHPMHQLPCINVTTPQQEYEEEQSSNTSDAYSLIVETTIRAKKSADLDDELDGIDVEIHQALMASSTLAVLVSNLTLVETETELEDEGKHPHGKLTMRWGCLFHVSTTDPEVITP